MLGTFCSVLRVVSTILRVRVCRAGAAERAYPRRERLARSRAAEPPDVAASAGPTAMPCTYVNATDLLLFTEFFLQAV